VLHIIAYKPRSNQTKSRTGSSIAVWRDAERHASKANCPFRGAKTGNPSSFPATQAGLLPGTVIDRWWRRRRRWRRQIGGCDHGCWRIHRLRDHHRRRRYDNRRRAHNAVHKRSSAENRPGHAPSAMMAVVMEAWAAHHRRTAVKPSMPTMETRAWPGKHYTGRCDDRHHYYQFLVHVFLHFLSLSTLGKAHAT